jgi:hypothetical protein
MENNTRAIRAHESGKKHIANAEKFRADAHDQKNKLDSAEAKRQKIFDEIERKAALASAYDELGQAPPAHLTQQPEKPKQKAPSKHSHLPPPPVPVPSAPVPVGSGCYLGHDNFFYYYDASTAAYSAVDAEWAQSYIDTHGVLQFAGRFNWIFRASPIIVVLSVTFGCEPGSGLAVKSHRRFIPSSLIY